jgi:hypothetical protein
VSSVLGEGGQPDLLHSDGIEDGGRDLGIAPGRHVEAHVAIPTGGEEPFGAAGRVGPHDHVTGDQVDIVFGVVPGGDLGGELDERSIQHGHVVGDGVGPGVAGTEQTGEGFTGLIGKAEHRVEPEPAFVGGSCLLLVLRVDLDQGGVDIEDHRRCPRCR